MHVYRVFVKTGRPITALNRVAWNCDYSFSSHGRLEVVYLSILPRRPITALNRVGWNVGYSSSSHGLLQVECCDWLTGQHVDRQLFILFYCLTLLPRQLVNTLHVCLFFKYQSLRFDLTHASVVCTVTVLMVLIKCYISFVNEFN